MQQATFEREIDSHIIRLTEAYKVLLRKSIIDEEGNTSSNDELIVSTSAANIVYHSQALLDKINKLKTQLILQDSISIYNDTKEEEKRLKVMTTNEDDNKRSEDMVNS